MPRPSRRRRLSDRENEALRRGVLRAWRPGDTASTVAERLNRPERRILDAIRPDFITVHLEQADLTEAELSAAYDLPPAFVKYVRRHYFVKIDERGGLPKRPKQRPPWYM